MPQGGRPRVSDWAALSGSIRVLCDGKQGKRLQRSEVGCSGKTSWRRRLGAWQVAGIWTALHRAMLEQLQDAAALDWARAALDSANLPAKKGLSVGPELDRLWEQCTKSHLVVNARGMPLGLTFTGACCHDSRMLGATLDAAPCVRTGWRGRPRGTPNEPRADKGYDHRCCRREGWTRGITPWIARRGIESSQHFGGHRWSVKRTVAWLTPVRRLSIGYAQRADIHLALPTLA